MQEINIKVTGAFTFKAVQNKRMSFKKGEVVKFTMEQDEKTGATGPFSFRLPKQDIQTIRFAYDCDTTSNRILKIKRSMRPGDLTWGDITTRIYE